MNLNGSSCMCKVPKHVLQRYRNVYPKTCVQEHIEELSSINWAHVSDGGAEGSGVAASLRKQLKAKDLELRQVQRNMGQWKEQTAARLACKFEEELTAELERYHAATQPHQTVEDLI